MDMRRVKINKGKTVPLHFRFAGALILGVSVVMAMNHLPEPWSLLLAILLCTLVPALWFATDIIIIDRDSDQLFDGAWTMGFRIGKTQPLGTIEKLEPLRIFLQRWHSLKMQPFCGSFWVFG